MKHTLTTGLSTVGALVLITACGSSSGGSTDHGMSTAHAGMSGTSSSATSSSAASSSAASVATTSGAHNAADVSFATDMIPHHTQAVTMSALVEQRSTNPKVIALADRIMGEQQPEIARMTAWLTAWGSPAPSGSNDMGGMDMGGSDASMPGMMSNAELGRLSAATGTAFDTLWLTMMIAHHRGAITMSRTELAEGRSADAQALAQSIITAQQAEITTMTALLR